MKLCESCSEEISTKDGENACEKCDGKKPSPKKRSNRRVRESILRDLGLTKVRGAMGGTYYE